MRPAWLTPWALRFLFAVAAIGWMAFIFRLSSLSPAVINESAFALTWMGHSRDIAAHLVIYAILGMLLYLSIWSWRSTSEGFLRWATAAVLLSLLYGISDEYHQSTVMGRTASVLDVLIDTGGAILGVTVVKFASVCVKHPVWGLGIRHGVTGRHE